MADAHAPPRTILVPLDLAPAGEVKIPVAEEYARALSADVLLLHVLRPGSVDPANVLPSEAVARTYLDTFGARLRGAAPRQRRWLGGRRRGFFAWLGGSGLADRHAQPQLLRVHRRR